MKIILFLLAVLPFFVACSSNDEEKKSYAQQQSELQEEMYDKIKNNIVVRIPADPRSPIPVISVHSVGNLQYLRQS